MRRSITPKMLERNELVKKLHKMGLNHREIYVQVRKAGYELNSLSNVEGILRGLRKKCSDLPRKPWSPLSVG